MMNYKTYQQFKKSGLIDCGYFKIAIWIPIILWTELIAHKISGIDFHWSEIRINPFK